MVVAAVAMGAGRVKLYTEDEAMAIMEATSERPANVAPTTGGLARCRTFAAVLGTLIGAYT